MNKYTIYCTKEQTNRAVKLGAVPQIIDSQERLDKNMKDIRNTYGVDSYAYKNATYYLVEERYKYSPRVVVVDKVAYSVPTAEQMIEWLEEQDIFASINHISKGYSSWLKTISTSEHISENLGYVSTRKEAIFEAIDAALEYLENLNNKVMNQYAIYCTKEQTRKAFELGAPIKVQQYVGGQLYEHSFADKDICYYKPTAEEMAEKFRELLKKQ